MKAAIITPAVQDRERLYGAERHFLGMVEAFRRKVDTDWMQVPMSEARWETILEAYADCYNLDLSGYDLVISTKSPTYMARLTSKLSVKLRIGRSCLASGNSASRHCFSPRVECA
jgi:hypothetical protein